jgi:hypothetical protein
LARNGEGHPDPVVASTAVAAARAHPFWFERVMLIGTTVYALVPWAGLAVLRPQSTADILAPLGCWIIGFPLVILAVAFRARMAPVHVPLIEAANLRSLLEADPPGQAMDLTVHARSRRWWIGSAQAAIGVAIVSLIVVLDSLPPMSSPVFVSLALRLLCFGGTTAGAVWLQRAGLPAWTKRRPWRRHALLILAHDGVTVPHLGVTLPWERVAAIDVEPNPPERGAPVGVAFYIDDPEAVWRQARPPAGRRTQLKRMLDHGSISLPTGWGVKTPEQIIRAAAAFVASERAEAPISR